MENTQKKITHLYDYTIDHIDYDYTYMYKYTMYCISVVNLNVHIALHVAT